MNDSVSDISQAGNSKKIHMNDYEANLDKLTAKMGNNQITPKNRHKKIDYSHQTRFQSVEQFRSRFVTNKNKTMKNNVLLNGNNNNNSLNKIGGKSSFNTNASLNNLHSKDAKAMMTSTQSFGYLSNSYLNTTNPNFMSTFNTQITKTNSSGSKRLNTAGNTLNTSYKTFLGTFNNSKPNQTISTYKEYLDIGKSLNQNIYGGVDNYNKSINKSKLIKETEDANVEDIKILLDCYSIKDQKLISYSPESRQAALIKYNIKKQANNAELEAIEKRGFLTQKKIKQNKEKSDNNYASQNYTAHLIDINKPKGQSVKEEYFENPFKAVNELSLNRQIFNRIMDIQNQKQFNNFMEKYEKSMDFKIKQVSMPEIKESKSSAGLKMNKQENIDYSVDGGETNRIMEKRMRMTMSREHIFNNCLDFPGKIIRGMRERPSARSLFTMTIVNNSLYVYGGIKADIISEMWICKLYEDEYKWINLTSNIKEEELPEPSYGHTACLYKFEIYIFGGQISDNRLREDVTTFHIHTLKFTTERCLNKAETPRRNHIAEVIGNVMLIHGGLDKHGKVLSDSWLLEFQHARWNKTDIKINHKYPFPGLANHSSALVVSSDKRNHPNFHIYKSSENLGLKSNTCKIAFEGVYIFGGIDDDREPHNTLHILRIGKRPLEWLCPKISGSAPASRMNATLNFFEDLNTLILYGGRNDIFMQTFNDIWMLDLLTFNWFKVNIYDVLPQERSEHCSALIGDKMIVLGGLCHNAFGFSDIYQVVFDALMEKKKGVVTYTYEEAEELGNIPEAPKIEPYQQSLNELRKNRLSPVKTLKLTKSPTYKLNLFDKGIGEPISPVKEERESKSLINLQKLEPFHTNEIYFNPDDI